MDKSELLSIIQGARENSLGVNDGTLSAERATALNHYHGRPYGNEVEGLSQVVSRDLSETIDWIMPAILEVFLKSGNLCEFVPQSAEDENEAQQASDYTNWVIMEENPGFMVLHDACKDALLLKNGYVKHYWCDDVKEVEEEYHNLTVDGMLKIDEDYARRGVEVEITSQEEGFDVVDGVQVPVFHLKIKLKEPVGRVVIEATPTEELRVSRNCRGSLRDADFVEHVTTVTRSKLLEMGMDYDFVDKLAASDSSQTTNQVDQARDSVDESGSIIRTSFGDRTMDYIDYTEAYIRVDYDGDGKAELRKIVTVADKIPDGDEWNERIDAIPFSGFVAKRVPHRHVGESIDDELAELQEIKTALLRQTLDNIYGTNHNQWAINDRVNIADFLESLPGGVKRVSGIDPVNGSIEPILVQPIVQQILPVIDYVDNIKSNRTGVSNASVGVDPDALQNTTKGAYMENANRAAKKVEMYIRMLAESGLRELCQNVYSLVVKYQDREKTIKLRGQYVPINPKDWKERTNLKINIGLGTGTEEERRMKLQLVGQMQDGLAPYSLVGAQQKYQIYTDIAKTLGFDSPEKYAITPGTPEHQQAQQAQAQAKQAEMQAQTNVLAQAEQVKGQFMLQKVQFESQLKSMAEKYRNELAELKLMYEDDQAGKDRASKEAIKAAELELEAFLAGFNMDIGPRGMGTMPSAEGGNG